VALSTGGSSSAVADNITEEAVSSLRLEPGLMLGEQGGGAGGNKEDSENRLICCSV
jgi:hypothetical protein